MDRNWHEWFMARVDLVDTGYSTACWIWNRRKENGYGRTGVKLNGRKYGRSHRIAYVAFVAEIPPGLQIDHLCFQPGCCNPEHLEPVTVAENCRRAAQHRASIGKRLRRSPYPRVVSPTCGFGHIMVPPNMYRTKRGWRRCRECDRLGALARKRRQRDALISEGASVTNIAPFPHGRNAGRGGFHGEAQ